MGEHELHHFLKIVNALGSHLRAMQGADCEKQRVILTLYTFWLLVYIFLYTYCIVGLGLGLTRWNWDTFFSSEVATGSPSPRKLNYWLGLESNRELLWLQGAGQFSPLLWSVQNTKISVVPAIHGRPVPWMQVPQCDWVHREHVVKCRPVTVMVWTEIDPFTALNMF